MKYLSVCSGIEAASVAWESLGWKPVGFSEIEPFPCAVLSHHYPNIKNFGDMTKWEEWPNESVDVLVGGTPCQSFSVAGLRQGLMDARGKLMLGFIEIARRYRPRWIIWENVPGVLSSGRGRDFGSFLREMGQLGYGWAYRVLDAQFFGVPQRRRRVFVVGCFGDAQCAAKVLFEREGLSRDIEARRQPRKNIAKCLAARVGTGGFDCDTETPIIGFRGDTTIKYLNDLQPTLTRNMSAQVQGVVMSTLCAKDAEKWGCNQWVDEGKFVIEPIAFNPIQDPISSKGVSHSVGCGSSYGNASIAVCVNENIVPIKDALDFLKLSPARKNSCGYGLPGDPAFTLTTAGHPGVAHPRLRVRRLTPRECERLQGFPDDYTNIQWRGKSAPDSPRYKALGNSMAVPVMRWIGQRIAKFN